MDKWDELRTAYHLARLGTVSATAEALGVHRATVVRHVDVLEAELGARLFQRHARGYTLTEAGHDLARVAGATEERFTDLAARTRGRAASVEGEVIVTSIELMAPLLLPALLAFRLQHPDTRVRYEASNRLFKLEYGEAHVAVRTGRRPDHPDNVVRSFGLLRSALYAHRSYIAQHGQPTSPDEYGAHSFISDASPDTPHIVSRWLSAHSPDARVVFSSANRRLRTMAIESGVGIGFHPVRLAQLNPDLVQVHPPQPEWDLSIWLVTHVDLHRTAKVQAVLQALRERAHDEELPR